MKGVAPQAQLLNLKVFGGFADEIPNDVARAIHDAVDLGADVINLSLGLAQPHQSLTDEEQAAVKYATDHGVFVSVAGSNYGHAGSLETNANDLSDSTTTTYEPANSGTIADPGVANSAMTVGSANTKTGSKSAMSSFSAWGPTPEFAFKPDITAPGDHIATIDENKTYTFDSGTSFASPYIAGSAALVLQKIHKDQPNLKGAALVNAAKVALMNASQPMNNSQFPGEIVSPRLQGAGVVNVANAANLNAAATDAATGSGAVASDKSAKSPTSHLTSPTTAPFPKPIGWTRRPVRIPRRAKPIRMASAWCTTSRLTVLHSPLLCQRSPLIQAKRSNLILNWISAAKQLVIKLPRAIFRSLTLTPSKI